MISQKSKVIAKTIGFLAVALLFMSSSLVFAVDEDTNFNVNVKETLSVTITTPTTWAVGNVDTFLRNDVHIDVTTNNASGFTASMTTKTDNTALINTSKSTATLPTLSASTTRASFPANYWGYSLDDTAGGSSVSTYSALVGASSTPITILQSNSASSGSRDFYFGAKANSTKAAGTYSGTVVVSVVTGVINPSTNPNPPTNPDKPNPVQETPTYDSTHGTTTYTYSSTSAGTHSTTTEISAGDNRSTYDGYTPPQGVTHSTTSRISTLPTLATGLAVASSVAMASGIFFLFAARREEDDDEDEDEES